MSNFMRYDEPVQVRDENVRLNPESFRKGGTVEVNTMHGEVRDLGVKQVNAAEITSPFQGDILSTLRTRTGSPIVDPSRMSDDNLITYKGLDMTVAQAKGLGLIQDDGRGGLAETGRKFEGKSQETTNHTDDLSGGSKQIKNTLIAGFGEDTINALTSSVIGNLFSEDRNGREVDPEVAMEKAVNSFVSRTGADPELAEATINKIITDHSNEAARYITRNFRGVDGQAVINWAAENLSSTVKADVYRRVFMGDTRVLRELVDRYFTKQKR